MTDLRIQFCGPSGIGKTTLANYVSKEFNIPFVDGSYSTLIPKTRDISHRDMLDRDAHEVYKEYLDLASKRYQAFLNSNNPQYVSDRSFLDIITYTIDSFAYKLEACDIEFLSNLCKQLLLESCSHLIILPYEYTFLKLVDIEDNHKRVLNPYYQWKISRQFISIMEDLWGVRTLKKNTLGVYTGEIFGYSPKISQDSVTKVLIINYWDSNIRKKSIKEFLKQ